jgi:hypothetical protein
MERIPSLQHNMLLHLIPLIKKIWSIKFKVGCLGFYALRYYYWLEYAYWEYYHQHQIVVSNRQTFAITQMETILDHVVSQVHAEQE